MKGFLEDELRRQPSDPLLAFLDGDVEFAGGSYSQATKAYRAAIAGFSRSGQLEQEVGARLALVVALDRSGQVESSLLEARSAAERAEEVGSELRLRARNAFLKGLQDVGRFSEGFEAIKRWKDSGAPISEEFREYSRVSGNLLVSLGRWSEADQIFEKLRQVATEAGRPDWEATALYGKVRIAMERAAENPHHEAVERIRQTARDALRAALGGTEKNGDVASLCHGVLGKLSEAQEADSSFEDCLRWADGKKKLQAYCLIDWARVLGRHGLAEKAWNKAREALELASGQGMEAEIQAWRELMIVAWARNEAPQALDESWEALHRIEDLRQAQRESSLRSDLFATWSDDYLWLSGRILETERSDLLPTAFEVTERMRGRSLLDVLSARETVSTETFTTLEEVRAALAPDQALLSFQVAPWKDWAGDFGGGSWLLVVTPEAEPRVIRLRRDRTFWRRAVRTFVGLTAGRDGREEESAAALYEDLLGPALAELPAGIRRLVLVPDDVLHKLPFELLRPAPGEVPLGERFEVSRVPSATLWRHWRETAAEAPAMPGWVVADPSPLPPGPGGRPLPALPYAAVEGRETARSLGVSSRLEVATAALEADFVRQRPALTGVLHFGTHAVADEDHPDRSAIFLGAGDGEDGRLEPDEIVASPVAGRLVVLSSCESAAGLLLRGEGVLSLARAFFEGRRTRAVVASLWPLRDDDAQAFFARFYRHLARGETVAAAVREVRGELRAAGYPAEAWAGVVVLGDGELVPNPPREAAPGGAVAPGFGVLVALGAAWWNRRRAALSRQPQFGQASR